MINLIAFSEHLPLSQYCMVVVLLRSFKNFLALDNLAVHECRQQAF